MDQVFVRWIEWVVDPEVFDSREDGAGYVDVSDEQSSPPCARAEGCVSRGRINTITGGAWGESADEVAPGSALYARACRLVASGCEDSRAHFSAASSIDTVPSGRAGIEDRQQGTQCRQKAREPDRHLTIGLDGEVLLHEAEFAGDKLRE